MNIPLPSEFKGFNLVLKANLNKLNYLVLSSYNDKEYKVMFHFLFNKEEPKCRNKVNMIEIQLYIRAPRKLVMDPMRSAGHSLSYSRKYLHTNVIL